MPSGTDRAHAAPLSLEARIQRLEDEKEIRDLLVEYGRRLDARDHAGYAQLFSADAEWVGQMGQVKGRLAIQEMLERGLGPTPPGFRNTSSFHLMTNFQIFVEGDTARALSRLAYVVKSADNAPVLSRGGHYDDEFVREDGRWKFRRRVVQGDIPFNDPLASKESESR